MTEDDRPQVALDVNYENGMGVSIGRLREDKVYDWKFIGLSHNTARGAAGGAGRADDGPAVLPGTAPHLCPGYAAGAGFFPEHRALLL